MGYILHASCPLVSTCLSPGQSDSMAGMMLLVQWIFSKAFQGSLGQMKAASIMLLRDEDAGKWKVIRTRKKQKGCYWSNNCEH